MWRNTRSATTRSLDAFRTICRPFSSNVSLIFWRFDQLTGLQRHHSKAAHKDHCHKSEEGCCEIADLKLPEHEGQQGRHQKQQVLLNLNGLVVVQIAKNHACHRQTNGKHHNGFDHAVLVEMLGVLSRTAAAGGFTVAWPEEADFDWGCQVVAAEQRVGFFNQELRPIITPSTDLMIAAVAQKICLIGDGRCKRGVD